MNTLSEVPSTSPSANPFSSLREVQRDALTVVGHCVRSSHDTIAEHAPIFWGKATTDPRMVGADTNGPAVKGPPFFGVYFDYETDFSGAYSMLVGVETSDDASGKDGDLKRVTLPAGLYCEIVVDDPNPTKVVAAWTYVWHQLESRGRRTYAFDYEVHSQTQATIFIGLAAS